MIPHIPTARHLLCQSHTLQQLHRPHPPQCMQPSKRGRTVPFTAIGNPFFAASSSQRCQSPSLRCLCLRKHHIDLHFGVRGVDCSCSGHSISTESTESTVRALLHVSLLEAVLLLLGCPSVIFCIQTQMGDESGGGYTSPPPCLIDLTTPLDQEQDDAEIQLFKVDQRAASSRKRTSHCSAGHVDRLVSANTRGTDAGGQITRAASTTAAS